MSHSSNLYLCWPFLLFFSLVSASSCSRRVPEDVRTSLEVAGGNRRALEDVIEHYQNLGDDEKLKAAYFLVANMKDRYSLEGTAVSNYDYMFQLFDSLHRHQVKFGNNSPLVYRKWDSLEQVYGPPHPEEADMLMDLEHLNAKMIIEQIDDAFAALRSKPWGKSLPFNQFCELVLPYRITSEPIEAWRKPFIKEYQPVWDTLKQKTSYQFAEGINYKLKSILSTNHAMANYPFAIPASKMRIGRRGTCYQLVSYTAMAMRANGLPVSIDKVNLWGNRGGNHSWNSLLLENGRFFPFNAAQGALKNEHMFIYRFAKAFRETFAIQKTLPDAGQDIPESLLNDRLIDVTQEYTRVYDIKIPLRYPNKEFKKYALICTFDNKNWRPQYWGEIDKQYATFDKMGAGVLYRVMYYSRRQLRPASDPFILNESGKLLFFAEGDSGKQDMILTRKYPMFGPITHHLGKVIGGKLQGANKSDFSDSVTLYTITKRAEKLEEARIENKHKFRYVRYISPAGKIASIAEFQVYRIGENRPLKGDVIGAPERGTEFPLKNAVDGKLETFFYGNSGAFNWVGIKLAKPVQVEKIRYCPQNDTNFIIEGNVYELFYWDKLDWVSAGKLTATEQFLNFKNVPVSKLYLLKDMAGGKEIRPFTYEKGKQIWW